MQIEADGRHLEDGGAPARAGAREEGPWQRAIAWLAIAAVAIGSVLLALQARGPGGAGEGESYETVPAVSPEDAPLVAVFDAGVSALEQYDYLRAYEKFSDVAKARPAWAAAHANAGLAALNLQAVTDDKAGTKTDFFPIAEKELREAIRLDPRCLHAHFALGILLKHLERNGEALREFEVVVQADPSDPFALCEHAALLPPEKAGQAASELEGAVKLQPAFATAIYKLASLPAILRDPQRRAAILEAFKLLESGKPGNETVASIKTGEAYGVDGKYSTAIRSPFPPRASAQSLGMLAQRLVPRPVPPSPASRAAAPAASSAPGPQGSTASRTVGAPFVSRTRPDGSAAPPPFALGDLDGDGVLDLVLCGQAGSPVSGSVPRAELWKGSGDGSTFERVSELPSDGIAIALGDLDSDGDLDIVLAGEGSLAVLDNDGKGGLSATKLKLPAARPGFPVRVLAFDADADWDLDILVLRQTAAAAPAGGVSTSLELLNNNRDGTFTDIAGEAGIASLAMAATGALSADLDGDIDLDVLVLGPRAADARVILNDRAWRYRTVPATEVASLDALLHRGLPPLLAAFPPDPGESDAELRDAAGRPYLLRGRPGSALELIPAGPAPSSWLGIELAGPKEPLVKVAWSNLAGAGAIVEAGWGALSDVRQLNCAGHGGASGPLRAWFDLAGAPTADFVRILWPDSVLQSEAGLAAGRIHRVQEVQRKPTSCPIVFAWDGSAFRYAGDFLGVGGLGYLEAPGVFSKPDPTEVLELPALGTAPGGDGAPSLEVSLIEPLEECTYLDAVELVAADCPPGVTVHPQELFAVRAPAPGAGLLAFRESLAPARAEDGEGRDVTAAMRAVDRVFVEPRDLDLRFPGAARPHAVVLDWDRPLPEGPAAPAAGDARPVLFLDGYVEYGYSTSNFAAAQARVALHAPTVLAERGGRWVPLREEWGFPGGTPRWMAVDLGGKLAPGDRRLRIETDMDISWDQGFVALAVPVELGAIGARPGGRATGEGAAALGGVRWTALAPDRAELRFRGFPRRASPDGRRPSIYLYDDPDPKAPMKPFPGRYTRYGDVADLVGSADDRLAVMGEGDEALLGFRADRLPPLPEGWRRTFFLAAVGYCKDMDLYTAASDRVEPLPFRAMSAYPPPPGEAPASDAERERAARADRVVEPLRLGAR